MDTLPVSPLHKIADDEGLPVVLPDIIVMRRQVVTYVYLPAQKLPAVHRRAVDGIDQGLQEGNGAFLLASLDRDDNISYIRLESPSKPKGEPHG